MYRRSRTGSSCLQGAHQDARKSTTTTLPLSEATSILAPRRSLRPISGSRAPASSAAAGAENQAKTSEKAAMSATQARDMAVRRPYPGADSVGMGAVLIARAPHGGRRAAP